MRRTLTGLVIACSLAGCASVQQSVDKGSKAIGEALLPVSEERQLGKQLAAQVNQEEPILNNKQVQDYVSRVGQLLVKASGDKRFTYTFTVVDKPGVVNAFALPGGPIYVYSGLIQAADSEAELASVLAHEVGHVTERHAAAQLGTQFGLQTLAGLALGNNPGQLQQLATGIAAQGYMMRHSRDAEREADSDGLAYLIKAGYDPKAMPAFFRKLERIAGGNPNAIESFFASHPAPGERAKTLSATVGNRTGKSEIIGGFADIKRQLGSSPAPKSGTPPKSGTTPKSGGTSSGTPAPPPPARK